MRIWPRHWKKSCNTVWVRDLSVGLENGGIVLRGQASTYHAKQLAQHWAMKESQIPILANQIEVH
jgi:osmotically-inducible protein OsmY